MEGYEWSHDTHAGTRHAGKRTCVSVHIDTHTHTHGDTHTHTRWEVRKQERKHKRLEKTPQELQGSPKPAPFPWRHKINQAWLAGQRGELFGGGGII